MKRVATIVALVAFRIVSATPTAAQQVTVNDALQIKVPVREVVMSAVSTESFRTLLFRQFVRALPEGKLLINDWGKEQLIVMDSPMGSITTIADDIGTTGTPYPGELFPLIRYRGDSTLIADWASSSLLIANPLGIPVRAIAVPKSRDVFSLFANSQGHPGIGAAGQLYYRALQPSRFAAKDQLERAGVASIERQKLDSSLLDTIGIVRANFETRTVDTFAHYTIAPDRSERTFVTADGKSAAVRQLAPFAAASDDWGMLSDGTLAILRAHDYHVDLIAPNGAVRSGPKLPYYAKRLTDADKIARIDSMKRVIDSVNSTGTAYGQTTLFRRTAEGASRIDTVVAKIAFDALDKIPDYLPAYRENTMQIDNDERTWVLPTALAERISGTLYDVIERNGVLVERLHFSDGVIALGFRRGNVVDFAKSVPGTD